MCHEFADIRSIWVEFLGSSLHPKHNETAGSVLDESLLGTDEAWAEIETMGIEAGVDIAVETYLSGVQIEHILGR